MSVVQCVKRQSSGNNKVDMWFQFPTKETVHFSIYLEQDTVEQIVKDYKNELLPKYPHYREYMDSFTHTLTQVWPIKVGRFLAM